MIEDLRRLAEQGYSKTEAARKLGVGRLRVHRLAKKHPELVFRRGSSADPAEFYDFRQEIRGMPPHEAVEYLLDVIDMALPQPQDLDAVYAIVPAASRQEARVFGVLLRNLDRVMSGDTLWNAATFERKRAGSRLISIIICNLRRKLRETDADYRIETVWGTGYRLERGRGD